ncbi:hypothetical protein JNA92_24440 [Pseudomonas putida]|nr:hypothetical protein [Pseudomonas putida]
MFTTDRFFAKIWSAWTLVVIVTVLMIGLNPTLFAIPAFIVVVAMTLWCIHCAYRTEYFVSFANLRVFFNVSCAPMFASLLILGITFKKMKLSAPASLMLGLAPVVLVLLAYAAAYYWRSKNDILQYKGRRVESIEPPQQVSWWQAGLAAGLSSVIYPLMKSHDVPATGLIYCLMLISVYMVFYNRDKISALRDLKAREAKENGHYIFMDIEAIQSMRAASWLGRLFAVRAR